MATNHIDFWFTMGSSYSYLSVMRLLEVERSAGIRFDWRPFHLLVILQEMKHVPFADKPAKSAYMWRDIERRAVMYGIPASLPAQPICASWAGEPGFAAELMLPDRRQRFSNISISLQCGIMKVVRCRRGAFARV